VTAAVTLLAVYLLTLGLVARLGRPEIAYVVTPIVFVIIVRSI
jgi:hypothetical protein